MLLSVEVEACIHIEIVDGIAQTDSVAPIVIEVAHERGTCKPVGVVPNNAGARDKVEVEVFDVAPELFSAEAFAFHLFDADARR